LSGAVLFLAKTKGENINIGNFFGLAVIVALLLISPLLGIVFLIPITMIAWFRYYKYVIEFFYSLWRR